MTPAPALHLDSVSTVLALWRLSLNLHGRYFSHAKLVDWRLGNAVSCCAGLVDMARISLLFVLGRFLSSIFLNNENSLVKAVEGVPVLMA